MHLFWLKVQYRFCKILDKIVPVAFALALGPQNDSKNILHIQPDFEFLLLVKKIIFVFRIAF